MCILISMKLFCALLLVANVLKLRRFENLKIFQKDKVKNKPVVDSVSVPDNTVRFESDGTFSALIMSVVSAGEIWCRQIYTPEAVSKF